MSFIFEVVDKSGRDIRMPQKRWSHITTTFAAEDDDMMRTKLDDALFYLRREKMITLNDLTTRFLP